MEINSPPSTPATRYFTFFQNIPFIYWITLLYVRVCVCDHYVALRALNSMILFLHYSLTSIRHGKSSSWHSVPAVSWCFVSLPTFKRPCVGVHKRTSLMSSSLLHQQCPACLVRLIEWFERWDVSGRTAAVLWSAVSRNCSKPHVA